MPVRKPRPLQPGHTIGVVATAGCVDGDRLEAGVEAIRRAGFKAELAPAIRERKGYLAGAEAERAKALVEFFLRDDISAVFCARGSVTRAF